MTTPAMPELQEGATLEDLLIPLRAALNTCHDTDWSLRQFKPHITHALAALQSAQPAAVSDEAIYAVWAQHCQTPGTTTRQLVCGFARALPALSPAQQAPEWDGGEPANLQAAARDADEWLALIQRLNDAGRWRFSQPDSRPKLDGCRAALSKILCAPAQQAVPMTDGAKRALISNFFSEGWAQEQAMNLLHDYDQHHGITAQGAQEGV